jgi:hypothetical protein
VGWLVSLCQVLHWFNPLVWLAFHQMRLDREMACDALAMSYARDGEDARDYGLTLIRMQEVLGRPQPFASLAAICEGRSQLKARMERIAGFSRSRQGWPAAVPAALFTVLLAITGLTDATATQVRPLAVAGVDSPAGEMPAQVSTAAPAAGDANTLRPAAETAGGTDETEDLVLMADLLESSLPQNGPAPAPPSGPVYLHYGLDGVQARQVMDSGPAGRHGLVHGDPRPAAGVEGGALSFDGLDDFITVSTPPSDAFTVCLWVKPDQPVPAECRSVLIFVSSSAQFEVSTDGLARLEWRVQAGGNTRSFFSTQSAQPNREAWRHVAVTCDRGRLGLYLDGVRMDHQDILWTSAVQFLNVGGGSYGSWRGLIDEVAIYAEVLSSQRIQEAVSTVKPVLPGASALASSGQEGRQQGMGGFGPSPEVRQALARSTLMQLGTAVEVIACQWAPKVCGGNWRQADAMLTPLRMLSGQLHAATDAGDAVNQAGGWNGPSLLLTHSVAQAVEVLSQARGSGDSAEADVNEMADLVDAIVKAVVTRDGVGVQTGSSRLRQAYGHLLTTLALDPAVTFQTQLQLQSSPQFNRPSPRQPAARVRGRTRGR